MPPGVGYNNNNSFLNQGNKKAGRSGSGGSGIYDFLKTGGVSLATGNPLLALGAKVGGNLLKEFGFLGKSWNEEMREKVANWLNANKNQSSISDQAINRVIPHIRRASAPRLNRAALNASRGGVLRGQGEGEISRLGSADIANAMAAIERMRLQMDANRPFQFAQAIGGLT